MSAKTKNFIVSEAEPSKSKVNMKSITPTIQKSNTLFLVLILLFVVSCRDKPTPPPDDKPKPGKRDYTWTIDTLAYPGSFQTLMRDIYASSPTNVYVVGHNDQPGPGTMFRYDGKSWKTTRFHVADGGTVSGAVSLSAIHGFGPNDIYAVGERIYENPTPPPNFLDSSLIIHFDGISWKEIKIDKGNRLSCIWGGSSTSILAGGSYGTLYYYNGTMWEKKNFDSSESIVNIGGLSNTEYYASTVVEYADSLCYGLIRLNGPNWQSVDSFTVVFSNIIWKFGYYLWQSPSGVLYSSGHGVYKRVGNSWEKILNNDGPLFIYGSDDNNIYAVGAFGRIFHWNGTDWKRLFEIELNIQFTSVWTNNIETFIAGNDGYKTFIIHGK
ncbi:MAG: hypothetical protein QME58_11815 [Bacteroidota bacterium]|nr:hypothetical protein [Bacteroidota bacterium]